MIFGKMANTSTRVPITIRNEVYNMATVFCFTSTGNSLYAAKKIAEKIGGRVASINGKAGDCDDDVIGFVFPNFFGGLPRIARRFIAEMRIVNKDAYVFAVVTCGGAGFGVLGLIKKLLKSKKIHLYYGATITSVSNYLPLYEVNDSEALKQKVDEKIAEIADDVKNRKANRISSALSFLNKLIYLAYPNEKSDRYFVVAPTCTGCGICQKICPAMNVSMEAGNPVFQRKCEHCLACLHHCPAQAIDWKEKTKGKERFRNAGVSLDELIAFNSCNEV